eukprot:972037-Prymnesium_polylepis.1
MNRLRASWWNDVLIDQMLSVCPIDAVGGASSVGLVASIAPVGPIGQMGRKCEGQAAPRTGDIGRHVAA